MGVPDSGRFCVAINRLEIMEILPGARRPESMSAPGTFRFRIKVPLGQRHNKPFAGFSFETRHCVIRSIDGVD
jgi:hypothetical protein